MARKIRKTHKATATQPALRIGCTALYIRVSTDKQAEEGFSLEAQMNTLRKYCDVHNWPVCEDHIYIDAGVSGKTTDRVQFQRMMAAAGEGAINRIVALKLDRVARNTRDFLETVETLKQTGCDMVLIKDNFDTGTPQGKFALTMFAAIAELEASQIQERTMSGRREKARQGGDNGRYTPYGYTHDGETYQIDQPAADVVKLIFTSFNTGAGLTTIARLLNAEEAPTARGGKWYAGTVRYILTNGFYAGLIQYDGEEDKPGIHEAIIEHADYDEAIARLHSLKRGPA